MATVDVLTEIGPFAGDTMETVRYVSCDVCFETAVEDIWAGKSNEADWRRFYRVEPGGEVVCENCTGKLTEHDHAH